MKIVSTGRELYRESILSPPRENVDGSTTILCEHVRYVMITFQNKYEMDRFDNGESIESINRKA